MSAEKFCDVLGLQDLVAGNLVLIWEKITPTLLCHIDSKFGVCAHATAVPDVTLPYFFLFYGLCRVGCRGVCVLVFGVEQVTGFKLGSLECKAVR